MTQKTVHSYDDLEVSDVAPAVKHGKRVGKLQKLIDTLKPGQGIMFKADVYNESTPRAAVTAANKRHKDTDGARFEAFAVDGGWYLQRKVVEDDE